MIPVLVLTGFLGSGKTTLLAHLLRTPQFSRTAVIVNEFGEIGLDHELVETSDESLVELQTGCLCCAARGDLVRTLGGLLARRDCGAIKPFERVVIETSGLAEPAPILHALMSDPLIAERLALSGVAATVDAVNGAETLRAHAESVKQLAIADRLVLTKTDLAQPSESLLAEIKAINPMAELLTSDRGVIDPAHLIGESVAEARSWPEPAAHASHAHGHAARYASFVLTRDEPIRAAALTLFLEILAEHWGSDLLRLKGIVNIAESPERPAVIHGVQHVFHPPAWLDRWPSPDRRSRVVFIAREVPGAWVETLLAAVDAEIDDVTGMGARGTEMATGGPWRRRAARSGG